MTGEEMIERYCIPEKILVEYKNWKNSGGTDEYCDTDLEYLSQIITLREVGFEDAEVIEYLNLTKEIGAGKEKRLLMLQTQRNKLLTQIHAMEQILEHLDYLRYEIGKES